MPAGGFASALGAAILGGNQGYRDAQVSIAQKKLAALQQAILQDQVNELPKKHAEGDVDRTLALQGVRAFDDPNFLKASATAGQPIPTKNVLYSRINDIENGGGGPVLDNEQMASKMGVSPVTGAVISPKMILEDADQRRKGMIDQMQMDSLRNFATPSGGYELDPSNGLPKNSLKNRSIEAMGDPLKRITAMYGPATDVPSNVADRARTSAEAKAEIPPALLQRVVGGMNEMNGNLSVAQNELLKMYPGIDAPDDPNKKPWEQAYNGPMDLAKAKLARTAYNFMDTPYNKAIQSASLGNVQGWATLVPGRINHAIIGKLQEHQSAFGNETPRATFMRNKELIALLEHNKQDLLTPTRIQSQQQPTFAPSAPTPQAPLSLAQAEGWTQPPAAQAPVAAQPPAPAVQQSPTAQPGPKFNVKGKAIPLSVVTAAAQKQGMTPQALIQQIYQAGGTVTKDTK